MGPCVAAYRISILTGLNGCTSLLSTPPRKVNLNLVIVIRILVIHRDGVTPWLLSHHHTHRAITHKASCFRRLHSCSPLNRDPWAHPVFSTAQPGPQSSNVSSSSPTQEFSETTSVCLEWKITGLKSMYESTRGEQKSQVPSGYES